MAIHGAAGSRPIRSVSNPSGWDEVRCFNCHRVLCKIEPGALLPEKRVEVKCPKCKSMNYQIGAPAAAA